MPTLEDIKGQIGNLDGFSKFLGKREIKELPNILWENEKLEKLLQGTYNNSTGVLVATNKRLIFVDKGLLGGLKVEDFPYSNISSIQYETGMLLGKLKIYTSGNKADITNVEKKQVRDFAEYVRARITGTHDHASVSEAKDNRMEKLRELAKLKEDGILTEEEFAEQKRKLLG